VKCFEGVGTSLAPSIEAKGGLVSAARLYLLECEYTQRDGLKSEGCYP
jgi:hypothetical protein